MDLKECQNLAAGTVDRIDRKFNLDRDAQLGLSQLIEELGELARAVSSERLKGKRPERGFGGRVCGRSSSDSKIGGPV